jgi:hypothetical protein
VAASVAKRAQYGARPRRQSCTQSCLPCDVARGSLSHRCISPLSASAYDVIRIDFLPPAELGGDSTIEQRLGRPRSVGPGPDAVQARGREYRD